MAASWNWRSFAIMVLGAGAGLYTSSCFLLTASICAVMVVLLDFA